MTATGTGFQANGIIRRFGKRAVLDGLDLDVPPGCTLGLLGANGAGKTTLLRILLGLLPPDGGEARIAGEAPDRMSPDLRTRVGYVPQAPNQFHWLNGRNMLSYVAAFYPHFDHDYARELSDRWKVSLRTPIEALSPGQQQRLSVVRALASRPDFLILDEPMASLDPATRIAVAEELLAEQRRRAMAVIFSSHITGDLRRFCTHFAVMAGGRIALFETTRELEHSAQARSQDFESMLSEWMR